jgi:hypothetical protein
MNTQEFPRRDEGEPVTAAQWLGECLHAPMIITALLHALPAAVADRSRRWTTLAERLRRYCVGAKRSH